MPDQLPFIPSQSYNTRNLAPEQIQSDQIRELAWALRDAQQMGKLSPMVDRYALPTALTENSPYMGLNGYGVVDEASNVFDHYLRQSSRSPGAPPELTFTPNIFRQQQKAAEAFAEPQFGDREAYGNLLNADMGSRHSENQFTAESLVTALTDLSRRYPGNLALERWNGAGPAARHHRAKVEAQQSMLSDPRNAELMRYFNQFRQQPEEFP